MSAREEILARLRAGQRQASPPPAWRSRRRFEDLAARFCEALTAAQGEVVRAASFPEALDRLGEILRALEARRVVANDEPPLDGVDLAARWPASEWHVVGRSPGDLRAFCAQAEVGLGGASAALAETGTLVVASGPGRSRLATLLPPVHVALVSTAQLTSDLFTWVASQRGTLPAALTLISGPSKTADIGQTLALGMHGPKRLIVVLYEENG